MFHIIHTRAIMVCAEEVPGVRPLRQLRKLAHSLGFFACLALLPLLISPLDIAAAEIPDAELAKGPMPPEEAFRFRALAGGGGSYQLEWTIAPYYYLYLDKFDFSSDSGKVTFQAEYSDNSQAYDDPFFGQLAIFRNYVTIDITAFAPQGKGTDTLTATYQGCWEGGVCYPSETVTVPMNSFASGKVIVAEPTKPPKVVQKNDRSQPSLVSVLSNNSDQRAFSQLLESGRAWLLIAIFYLAGLALAFTPCVFPTIPLISGIISRQASQISTVKGLAMMGVFVLSMSLTYTLAGVGAGLLGFNLQVVLQQPWIIIASAVLFLFLAGSMFGLYTLQLPVALQNRLYKLSSKQDQGGYIGLGIMGVFSALIVGPCLTAPLAGILIYLGSKGDPVFGGIALFVLGLGMGTPLLLIGMSVGSILPKVGAWMEKVQHFFGFVMLLLTVWMLDRVLEDDLVLLLYGIVVIALAMYLLQVARHATEMHHKGSEIIVRTLAIALLVVGIAQVVGYSLGSKDVLQPLKLLQSSDNGGYRIIDNPVKATVNSIAGLDAELASAYSKGVPVLVKYEADWCIECKIIEREVFENDKVIARLGNASVSIVAVDVTEVGDESKALLARYNLPGPPALVFFDTVGKQRDDLLLLGNITKEKVLDGLDQLTS